MSKQFRTATFATAIFALLAGAQAPTYDQLVGQARKQIESAQFADAVKTAQQAIPLDVSRWEAYLLVGLAENDQKHYDQSVRAFAQALALAPESKRTDIQALLEKAILAKSGSGVPETHVGDSKVNSRDGQKYMWIPPGTFMMGCSPGDSECHEQEKPPHEVTLSKGFWLGETHVTQAAYRRVTGWSPSTFKGENLPVETVTWDDARSYCQAIGGRLPTEAEWEYAARADFSTPRHDNLDDIAWYSNNAGAKTHDVGRKDANAFGLFDILGNVWQWTADWYDEKYYQTARIRDPSGPSNGTYRTLRGGSWGSGPRSARVSSRGRDEPRFLDDGIGFRCVVE